MLAGICDEIIHVGLDGLDSTLHGRNRIALPTVSHTASHHCAELLESDICGTSAVHPFEIAPEDKHFVFS